MKKTLLILSFAGLLFSGYMSGVKLFTKTCAFGETCPLFFGLPACYVGFFLFLAITVLSLWLALTREGGRKFLNGLVLVSTLGVLFAGYYTLGELPLLFEQGFSAYVFGLPTCALGLLFFVAILAVTFVARRRGVDGTVV